MMLLRHPQLGVLAQLGFHAQPVLAPLASQYQPEGQSPSPHLLQVRSSHDGSTGFFSCGGVSAVEGEAAVGDGGADAV
jgi:hypothetical protein